MPTTQTIALYGIGHFGFALLKHFQSLPTVKEGTTQLRAYDRNPEVLSSLIASRRHPFLHKSVAISDKTKICSSPEELVSNADILVLAVTSDANRSILAKISPHLQEGVVILNTAKALEFGSGKRLSVVAEEALADKSYHYALLAGGTIAKELFAHEPLGADIASDNLPVAKRLARLLASETLHLYPTDDLIGVEFASAFKNVIAILAGIIKGMGLSYGAETHVISRAAAEVERIVTKELGGKKKTFSIGSQSWGNDLWMSCTGDSRNRKFGILLGKGYPAQKALQEMTSQHLTIEGIKTIHTLKKIKPFNDCVLFNKLSKLTAGKTTIKDIYDYIHTHY